MLQADLECILQNLPSSLLDLFLQKPIQVQPMQGAL